MSIALFEAFDILEKKIQKHTAVEFEFYGLEEKGLEIEIKDQKPHQIQYSNDRAIGIRLFDKNRVGFGFCTHLTKNSLNQSLNQAFQTLEHTPLSFSSITPIIPKASYPKINQNDEKINEYPFEQKLSLALELEKSALDSHPLVKQVHGTNYSESSEWIVFQNSSGLKLDYQSTCVSLSLMAIAEKNNSIENYSSFSQAISLNELQPQLLGQLVGKRAVENLGSKTIQTGPYAIVIENRAAAELIEFLAPSFQADSLHKGTSLLNDSLNQKIFPPSLELIDDPTLSNHPCSKPFDGEGVPSQKKILIKNQKVNTLLYDNYWAKKLGKKSTGNAIRENVLAPPSLGASILYIAPGSRSLSDLLNSYSSLVLIRELLGIHFANSISGDFSIGIKGFLIKNGEMIHPISHVTFSGNFLTILQNLEEIGDDLIFQGAFGSPSLLVGTFSLSGEN